MFKKIILNPFLYILISLISILFTACHRKNSNEKNNNLKEPKNAQNPRGQITIGNSGGFTGATTQYNILPTGEVTKIFGKKNEKTNLTPLSQTQLDTLYAQFEKIDIKNTKLTETGNLTKFITYTEPNQNTQYKITWGQPKKPAPEIIENFYTNTMKLLQKINNK